MTDISAAVAVTNHRPRLKEAVVIQKLAIIVTLASTAAVMYANFVVINHLQHQKDIVLKVQLIITGIFNKGDFYGRN